MEGRPKLPERMELTALMGMVATVAMADNAPNKASAKKPKMLNKISTSDDNKLTKLENIKSSFLIYRVYEKTVSLFRPLQFYNRFWRLWHI